MPLLLAMRFPPLGRARDLHPLEHDHAVRTDKGLRQRDDAILYLYSHQGDGYRVMRLRTL